jgi:hypothetical protein
MKRYRLVVAVEGSGTGPQPSVAPPTVERVYVSGVDPAVVDEIASDIILSAPCRYGNHNGIHDILGNLLLFVGFAVQDSTNAARKKRRKSIQDAVNECISKLEQGMKPTALKQRRAYLFEELGQLFEREPEQPGAAAIARKLKCRAADVRAEINRLVKDGTIEAVGTTRDRRYRLVPPESRPE